MVRCVAESTAAAVSDVRMQARATGPCPPGQPYRPSVRDVPENALARRQRTLSPKSKPCRTSIGMVHPPIVAGM